MQVTYKNKKVAYGKNRRPVGGKEDGEESGEEGQEEDADEKVVRANDDLEPFSYHAFPGSLYELSLIHI